MATFQVSLCIISINNEHKSFFSKFILKHSTLAYEIPKHSHSPQTTLTVVNKTTTNKTTAKNKPKSMPYMAYEQQQQITRLCVRCGLLLMQYGGESLLVTDLSKRLGLALGVGSVECALSFNAITLTTVYNQRCITTTRDTVSQAINVNMLIQIQRIVSQAERQLTPDFNDKTTDHLQERISQTILCFDELDHKVYSPWLVTTFVGGSCASFAHLNGGNVAITAITFVAGFLAMGCRLMLARWHFNPFIAVIMTAFVASLMGASSYFLSFTDDPAVAVASSVLLLVPSFPIINALYDILKGFISMGIGRYVYASMLTLSACVGIVMALLLLGLPNWG